MASKPFIYKGETPSGASFPDGTEVLFWPGQPVILPDPADNEYVAGLLERGYIEPLPDPQPEVKAPAKAAKTQGGE